MICNGVEDFTCNTSFVHCYKLKTCSLKEYFLYDRSETWGKTSRDHNYLSSFDLLPSLDGCRSLTFHILILIILFLFLNDVWKVNYKITSFCSDCLYDKHGFHMQIVLFLISKLGCNYYVQTCLIFSPKKSAIEGILIFLQIICDRLFYFILFYNDKFRIFHWNRVKIQMILLGFTPNQAI
jgi:hypothetical protein